MPPLRTAARIARPHRRREYILPTPGLGGVSVLVCERIRQPHRAEAVGQILLLQPLRSPELLLQRQNRVLRQHRHPVLAALAVAHDDLAALELDVLRAQAQPVEQTHAAAVQQARDQAHRAGKLIQ